MANGVVAVGARNAKARQDRVAGCENKLKLAPPAKFVAPSGALFPMFVEMSNFNLVSVNPFFRTEPPEPLMFDRADDAAAGSISFAACMDPCGRLWIEFSAVRTFTGTKGARSSRASISLRATMA